MDLTHEQDFLITALCRVVKRRESKRRYRVNNSEKLLKEKRRSDRCWRTKNPEKNREKYRRWAAKHNEKLRTIKQRSYLKNGDKAHEYRQLRRARKRGAMGDYTAEQFAALCAHFKHHCLKCGRPRKLTPDHVIPLAWSDRPEYRNVALNDIDNIQPLCKPCNSGKNARHVDYRTKPHRHCITPPMVEDYLA